MTEIKVSENFIPLNKKDFISSFDHIDNLILINFFDTGMHIYKFNEKINQIEFIENINFEEKILCAKFLKINTEIFIFFCCLSEENIKNTNLYSIKINNEESNIKFSDIKIIKNLNEFITNFSFYKILDRKNKSEYDYFIAESENSKQIYFYKIKNSAINNIDNENISKNNNNNDNSNDNNIDIEIEMNLNYKIDLYDLDFIYFTFLKSNNLFIVTGILNENLFLKDEENIKNNNNMNNSNDNINYNDNDNNNDNIIRFYKIENDEINLINEIFNPLKEITNSITYSNNSGLIIGSLSGRVCVFSHILINNKNEIEFKKFSFKSQFKILENDQQLFFPVTCLDSYKE
jgi:hypothetical protein